MDRLNRAKQFAPFDALKGLQDALHLKEYEHDRVCKGDLSEEKIKEISKVLSEINKNDIVKIKYFFDGHYIELHGKTKIDYTLKFLEINNTKINFDDIFEIEILSKKEK